MGAIFFHRAQPLLILGAELDEVLHVRSPLLSFLQLASDIDSPRLMPLLKVVM